MALHLQYTTSGPHDAPEGNLPARLADNYTQEGGEDVWVGLIGLGLPVVNFRLSGLRILFVGDGGGQNPQALLCIQGFVPHADWSGASF